MNVLVYLVVLFLLFNGFAADKEANSLIEKSCKRNLDFARDPKNYYDFCVASLKENPESQKVRNIDELTMVGTNNAIANITKVNGIMEKIIKERKYQSRLSKKLLQECIELYSGASHSLTSSLKYLKMRNYNKTLDGLLVAIDAPTACEFKFNGDNGQISPVKKETDVLFLMIDIPYMFHFTAHHLY